MNAKKTILRLVGGLLGLAGCQAIYAGDLLVPNYSFENGLASWTQTRGAGGITLDATQHHAGANSVKIVDDSDARECGLESDCVACSAGITYQIYAWARIESGGAELTLRFLDRTNAVISSMTVSKRSPASQWTYLSVQGNAPPGTVGLQILIGSNAVNTGTVYWDEILVTSALGDISDVGPQVFGASTHAAAFGQDAANNDKIYVIQDGAPDGGVTPAILHVVDANTLAVDKSAALVDSQGGWGIAVASDRKVYAGVYNTGHVFQITPDGSNLRDLGVAIPGETFLYGMSAGANGEIYGGTFPSAAVFKYTPGVGFSQLGPKPFHSRATYVRTTAYDRSNNVLYVGTGVGAKLLRLDLAAARSTETLPAQFGGEEFAYGTRVCGTKVLTHLLSSSTGVVLDTTPAGAATLDAAFPMGSLEFTPVDKGLVYYTNGRMVNSYNLATKVSAAFGQSWQGNAYAMTVMSLTDQARFPGKAVVGVSSFAGQIWINKTDISSGYTMAKAIAVAPMRLSIESIVGGPDGKIYSSGYLTGGTGIYTPLRSDLNPPTQRGVEQCEGMTTLKTKIYFGGYPQAYLYEYDPFSPWIAGSNPRPLFNLGPDNQDRPFGMTSDGLGKVYMGTLATYGALGGTVTEYNASTGTHTVHQHNTMGITDLSVIALAYFNGAVYGGTTVSGGLGIAPSQSMAKLLKYTVSTGTGVGIALPASITNRKAITAITVGPDQKIWMMVEGWLVIYDPATNKFDYQANLFPSIVYNPTASSVVARDAALITGKDGWVYGTIKGNTLFKLDPATKAMTVITSTNGGTGLAEDAFRNLYYFNGTNLRRYSF